VIVLATYAAPMTEEEHRSRFVFGFGQDVMLRLRLMDFNAQRDLVSKKRSVEQSAIQIVSIN
jgi:hypothetical protein